MNRRGSLGFIAATAAEAIFGRVFANPAEKKSFLSGGGMPRAVFDALAKTRIPVRGGEIELAFAPGKLDLPLRPILEWLDRAARSVTAYYGRFPVPSVRILIVPVAGPGVRGGTTWGYDGAAIRMLLGENADEDDLQRDWMMTHEMVHLALPDVARRHLWLAEGLAVYIEPIARAEAGYLTPASIWADMARDMPKGLPAPGDSGLDKTQTWASTYWGGALFCLLADIGYRRKTANRRGLQQAMRGVLRAGGDHEVEWPVGRILDVADSAVGVSVMTPLYERMRYEPVSTDLPSLWRELGVEAGPDGLRFDNGASLAAIRAAITEKPPTG